MYKIPLDFYVMLFCIQHYNGYNFNLCAFNIFHKRNDFLSEVYHKLLL